MYDVVGIHALPPMVRYVCMYDPKKRTYCKNRGMYVPWETYTRRNWRYVFQVCMFPQEHTYL